MQLPIMASVGIRDGAFSAIYPVNLEPRAIDSGVSKGQLVTTRGAVTMGAGPGPGRGGIAWNGVLYRVMGSSLCRIARDGAVAVLGDVGTDYAPVSFDYSFDRLAVRSAGSLFYCDGTTFQQVTDTDLGAVLDVVWMDGYFVTTDGEFVVVADLLDPTSVNPIKYGSAESDPDPITGLLRFRNELYVFGRYSIEVFQNVGGVNFPFQVVEGAMIPFGAVSADAKCALGGNSFGFVGGARDEPLGAFVFAGGNAQRISTPEIETLIAASSTVSVESRSFGEERHFIIHLDDRSVGIALHTSGQAEDAAWFELQSGQGDAYRIRNAVWCYDRHWVDDTLSAAVGALDADDVRHFGDDSEWTFESAKLFSADGAYTVGELELYGQFPTTPTAIFLSITRDGRQWSREIARRLTGRFNELVLWRPGVRIPSMAGFRWRGTGKVAISRCELRGE